MPGLPLSVCLEGSGQYMRKAITRNAMRRLFAFSGNRCAFPGCTHPLIDEDGDFIAQICHIEAASPDGERYNPSMTDDDRSHPANLMLLCYKHHVKTNNCEIYTVDALKKMKTLHESKFAKEPYFIPPQHLEQIVQQEFHFWAEIKKISDLRKNDGPEAIDMNLVDNALVYIERIQETNIFQSSMIDIVAGKLNSLPRDVVNYLKEIGLDAEKFDEQPYYNNPVYNIEWERMNIGLPNCVIHIHRDCLLAKASFLEMSLRADPDNLEIAASLTAVRKELREMALYANIYD
ncbi:hypothetical protein [Elioraea sp.]|uniref:hypothetical protein n=1 Tax=Elioraea sp. TaxID=2185103 RepID=UPI0025C09170|nr:hypothetical protein [Elioraea sp.]